MLRVSFTEQRRESRPDEENVATRLRVQRRKPREIRAWEKRTSCGPLKNLRWVSLGFILPPAVVFDVNDTENARPRQGANQAAIFPSLFSSFFFLSFYIRRRRTGKAAIKNAARGNVERGIGYFARVRKCIFHIIRPAPPRENNELPFAEFVVVIAIFSFSLVENLYTHTSIYARSREKFASNHIKAYLHTQDESHESQEMKPNKNEFCQSESQKLVAS